ncbi:hypothetical protein HHK36_003429 [Tetracentron sinense]|uniref:RING-type domain-containing protein n=1 Tax=Tetracentron sinense TaxID=13715 RepID=A0A834ZR62_TETSI|nr:hypothetical protein HHK36_003429 [Tetracentron sinense]
MRVVGRRPSVLWKEEGEEKVSGEKEKRDFVICYDIRVTYAIILPQLIDIVKEKVRTVVPDNILTFPSVLKISTYLSALRFAGSSLSNFSKNLLSPTFKMGLSSLPAPSEGVLCILMVNTALSISIFKFIVRSILHIVGIHLSSSDSIASPPESFEFHIIPSDSNIEEFRSRIPAIRFDSVCNCKLSECDCSVCLTRFEPDSEINSLSCGHLFHKVCLEKWLDYWNFTCPLCRTPLMPEEEASCL